MKVISWDDGLSVGIKKLDDDHKYLINIINNVISLVDGGGSLNLIHDQIDQLERFAVKHFRREEVLIEQCDTKLLEVQKEGHDVFALLVSEFRSYLVGPSATKGEDLIEMTESLVHWLMEHIIEQDLNLEPLFRAHGLCDVGTVSDALPTLPFFQRVSFVRGLEVLVLVSLIPMLIFASMLIFNGWRQLEASRSVIALAGFSEIAGNLVHELQRERGAASGYLASEGLRFEKILKQQREKTDVQVVRFVEGITTLSEEWMYPKVVSSAIDVAYKLDRISELRSQVDRTEINPMHSVTAYSTMIKALVAIGQQTARLTLDSEVHKSLTIYSLLIALKESAGQERAMGAVVFAQRGFGEKNYLQFIRLVAEQQILRDQIVVLLDLDQREVWSKLSFGKTDEEYMKLRDIIVQSGIRALSVSIDSVHWFELATNRIDTMMEYERSLISVMLKNAHQKGSHSSTIFLTSMFVALLIVLSIGYSAIQLTHSIRQPIVSLTRGMKALMAGDKTVRVSFLDRQDELGDMVRSYESFRRKLIRSDMLSQDKELGRLVASRHALELRRQTEQGEKYRKLAAIDRLTGALNRGEFHQRAKAEVSRAKRHGAAFSVLLMDLDLFKRVNDVHGHAMGDEVLKKFTKETATLLRDQDLLGRVGGEEFAILLVEADSNMAAAKAESIRQAVEVMEFYAEGDIFGVTVSIGVSEYGASDGSIDSIMARADHALYDAKRSGRNRVKRS